MKHNLCLNNNHMDMFFKRVVPKRYNKKKKNNKQNNNYFSEFQETDQDLELLSTSNN